MCDPVSCVVAVVGASAGAPPPGLEQPPEGCDLRFIPDRESLAREAADADVAFVWQPRLDWLATEWGWSRRLRWVAAATVGVDALLFPALVDSDIVVTNCVGVFDEAMAEYALTLVTAICADLHTTLRLQYERGWVHRETARRRRGPRRLRRRAAARRLTALGAAQRHRLAAHVRGFP